MEPEKRGVRVRTALSSASGKGGSAAPRRVLRRRTATMWRMPAVLSQAMSSTTQAHQAWWPSHGSSQDGCASTCP